MRFTDVPETHWAAKAIEEMTDKGYFEGYPDGTFKPEKTVTRAELAMVLDRYFSMNR